MSATTGVLRYAELPGLKRIARGKVRDIFEVEGGLLLVATDRVSAFDVVMEQGIPFKGRVLTYLSEFWFTQLRDVVRNHLITTDLSKMPPAVAIHRDLLVGRAMYVKRAKPLPIEFVVRGYLAGSGLKDYQRSKMISGVKLPAGLRESSRLPQPILTPSTKAEVGHDEPLDFEGVEKRIGKALAEQTRTVALALFQKASAIAESRGLLLADTKFEFGVDDGKLLWIDEALTPDSSRYWAKSAWAEGVPQQPFDKQVLRNYLLAQPWDQKPPPPRLSAAIIEETSKRYLETAKILTGRSPI